MKKSDSKPLVSDLSEFPPELLNEARAIYENNTWYEAVLFLKGVVTDDNRRYMKSFCEKVVIGGRNPKEWRRANSFIIDLDFITLLTVDIRGWPQIRDNKDKLVQLDPARIWWGNVSFSGAIGIMMGPLKYYEKAPKNYIKYNLTPSKYSQVSDLAVSGRRYIASRLARVYVFDHGCSKQVLTEQDLLEGIDISKDQFSHDAIKAMEGICKEWPSATYDEENIPGFVGEDILYK